MDVFRVFDALNDLRNLTVSIEAVKKAGKHAQGTICYTVSPVHTIDSFVAQARELEAMAATRSPSRTWRACSRRWWRAPW